MPAVKNVGEPCAGEPHARFDGGREETSDSRPCRATPGASRLPDQRLDVVSDDELVPRSDEQLARVAVGERKAHDAPVVLVDYDPAWPELFEREARRIRGAL